MTDTPQPAADGDSATTPPSAQADPETGPQRRSLWTRLNRTNRIAAVVLGAVAAVFVAALIFGAGLLVGAEYGDSEGHHDGAGTSEYGDGDQHEGDDGESAGDGERAGSEGAGSESDQGRARRARTARRTGRSRPWRVEGPATAVRATLNARPLRPSGFCSAIDATMGSTATPPNRPGGRTLIHQHATQQAARVSVVLLALATIGVVLPSARHSFPDVHR